MRRIAALMVLIIPAAFFTAGCGSGLPEADRDPPAARDTVEVADQIFDGFETMLSDNGIRKGLVRAVRAEKYDKRQQFRAWNLTVLFYTESGKVQSILTSRRGTIHTDTGNMEARDSVVVLSSDSTRVLRTEHLVWLKGDDVIRGDSAVVVNDPRGEVRGDAFTADVGFEEIKMTNPTGDINVLGTGY